MSKLSYPFDGARKGESTPDPSVLQLIKHLAYALLLHHTGYVTTYPFARTYDRDHELINQARDFLRIAEDKPQLWCSDPMRFAPGTDPK